MKLTTILNTVFSIIIGLYFAMYFTLLSKMSFIWEQILTAIIFTLFIWNIVSIYRKPNKKTQLIQLTILIFAIVAGLYKATRAFDSLR
ncbi:hypothetical protein [Psychroserpens damuponensis]|uniref:hypothetical protein n=1 Tax=Psychroserpens damuponensis TaxID=943936 RepID=UPI00058EF59A|nr:hypothetical protein [Psychroserpens damuponensis]